MGLIKQLRTYILEDEFQLHVFPNKVNVQNYNSIGHFDTNKVTIHYQGGDLVIKGKELAVSRLMNDEVLVVGTIESVELR